MNAYFSCRLRIYESVDCFESHSHSFATINELKKCSFSMLLPSKLFFLLISGLSLSISSTHFITPCSRFTTYRSFSHMDFFFGVYLIFDLYSFSSISSYLIYLRLSRTWSHWFKFYFNSQAYWAILVAWSLTIYEIFKGLSFIDDEYAFVGLFLKGAMNYWSFAIYIFVEA